MEEVISLDLEDLSSTSNTTIGPGVELLMNDKKTTTTKNNTENVDVLEEELNNLTDSIKIDGEVKSNNIKETLFSQKNEPINLSNESFNNTVKIDDNYTVIGDKTAEQESNANKTWDGFKQFDEIPTDPTNPAPEPKLSKDQMLREKFIYLKRLESLEKKGINLSQKYTIDSNLNEMKGEYEMIKSEKEKSNSVKFQAKMLMACVTGIEFLNNRFDPFDVNLDGWGDTVNENINDYDDVFAELHEKYQSKAKIAPELKLLFMLGGSAVMCHMTNTMFKSAMPGMDDILKQNPDLMKQFAGAAAQTMQKENTGFGNFMGDIMSGGGGMGGGGMGSGGMGGGGMGSGGMGGRSRVETNQSDFQLPSYNSRTERMSSGGIDINDSHEQFNNSGKRPEMKGPSGNINSILSNIKNKDKNKNKKNGSKQINTNINKQSSINEIMLGGPSNMPIRTERKMSKQMPQQNPQQNTQQMPQQNPQQKQQESNKKTNSQNQPKQNKKKSNKNKSEKNVMSLTI